MINSQLVNTILIVIGAAMLIYSFTAENVHVGIKIFGLLVMMFALYRATNFWVDTKDDHLEEKDTDKK